MRQQVLKEIIKSLIENIYVHISPEKYFTSKFQKYPLSKYSIKAVI